MLDQHTTFRIRAILTVTMQNALRVIHTETHED